MNEKIKAYAKCEFQIKKPEIAFSSEKIEKDISLEQIVEDSFTIYSLNGVSIEGDIDVKNPRIKMVDGVFMGTSFNVKLLVDTRGLVKGDDIKGAFHVIANGGEYELPFCYHVAAPGILTSEGMVYDITAFAQLAKEKWEEAVKLFASSEFLTLLYADEGLQRVYRCLRKGVLVSQALEEFLVYVQEKKAMQLSVEKETYEVSYLYEDVAKNILVKKHTWGYLSAEITCDDPAVYLVKTYLTRDDFLGDTCELPVVIEIDKLQYEKQQIPIHIKTVYQDIVVHLQVVKKEGMNEKAGDILLSSSHLCKIYQKQILKDYMAFRNNEISLQNYTEESLECVNELIKMEQHTQQYRLFRLHMYILQKETVYIEKELDAIAAHKETILVDDLSRCYYAYLQALYGKEKKEITKAVHVIEKYHEQYPDNFYIFWFLMYLDEEYVKEKAKTLLHLQYIWESGNNSPMLYYEVCDIYNKHPELLKEIDRMQMCCFSWGLRRNMLQPALLDRIIEVAQSACPNEQKMFVLLDALYQKKASKELLQVICSLLIKMRKTQEEYHHYFALGVEQSLKLLGLMEYYVKSMSMQEYTLLPRSVILYFQYEDHQLTDFEMAYFYANIVKNQKEYQQAYCEYTAQIQDFLKKQIKKGTINKHLMLLYKEALQEPELLAAVAQDLPNILCKQCFTCLNKNITAIIIYHDETNQAEHVVLNSGKAYIDILTDHVQIVMVDRNDNRYVGSVPYQLERVIEESVLLTPCYEANKDNFKVLLRLAQYAQRLPKLDYEGIKIYQNLLQKDSISKSYLQYLYAAILDYYYEQYEGDILEEYLMQLPLSQLDWKNQQKAISYMILRGLYQSALDAVEEYGYALLTLSEQKALCTFIAQQENAVMYEVIVQMAMELFEKNCYNDSILLYLVKYARGSSKELAHIYECAKKYSISLGNLPERMIIQSLLTDTYEDGVFGAFLTYLLHSPNHFVYEAFMQVQAYRAFLLEEKVPDVLWETFLELDKQNMLTSDLCKAALLYAVSEHPEKWQGEAKRLEVILWELVRKDMLFPFMTKLKDLLMIPKELEWKTFCIYIDEPGRTLQLQYLEDAVTKKCMTENMREYFCGYYEADFVLFKDEEPAGYIVDEERKEIVDAQEYLVTPFSSDCEKTRFGQLNYLLQCKVKGNCEEFMEGLGRYMETNYLMETNMTLL